MKIENIQNLNKMNNDFYNKNNILNKENKKIRKKIMIYLEIFLTI